MDGHTVSPDMFGSTHCSGRWRLPAHLHPHTCARGLKCKCSTHFQQYSPQMNSAPASGLALAIAVLSQRGKAPLLGGKEPFSRGELVLPLPSAPQLAHWGGGTQLHHTLGTALHSTRSSVTAFCHLDFAYPFFQGKTPKMNEGESTPACHHLWMGPTSGLLTPELSMLREQSHQGVLRTAGRTWGQKTWQQPLLQKCFK